MTYRMIARRDVLELAATGGLALLSGAGQRVWASNPSKEYPYERLSALPSPIQLRTGMIAAAHVFSGDPWLDGFVLWTRLSEKAAARRSRPASSSSTAAWPCM